MTMPFNADNERWLIGALLIDPKMQKKLPKLPGELVYSPTHVEIMSAIIRLYERKAPIELLSVSNELQAKGVLNDVGGSAYLLECTRRVPSTANAEYYLSQLWEHLKARRLIDLANNITHKLYDGEAPDACADELRTSLRNIETPAGKIMRMSELAPLVYEDVERRSRGEITGIVTKIPDLDRLIGCLEPGDMVVLGARPVVGKSAFGMQIAINVAMQGKSVLVCSREMRELQYGHRIASNFASINGDRLKRGTLSPEQWELLADACDEMGRTKISFSFDSATVEDLRMQAQHEKDMGNLDLLVVDYLQLLKTSQKTQKRYEAVGLVSRALKDIALDLRVPVIAMAQVGRQTVSMGGDRAPIMPDLSDLRESGNIEQDADIVIFLHHPTSASDKSIPSYDAQTRESIEAMDGHKYIVVRVAKQRQGECGSFGVAFDGAHMSYTCIER